MNILITGATGFTGSYIVPLLVNQGWNVTCFVRETSNLDYLPRDSVKIVYGDLNDPQSFDEALEDHEVLINVASLGFGHAPIIVKKAVQSGVKRAIFFSTTSIYTTINPESKSVRLKAESLIQDSRLEFSIIRPTMIYGSPRDRNICKFINFIRLSPIFPVFGSGEYKLQPVFVEDLAEAVVKILNNKNTIGKAYNLSGETVLSLNELVEVISRKLQKTTLDVHLPPRPFVLFLSLLEKISISFPISSEQIQRFNEDKDFSHQKAKDDFSYSPRPFSAGLDIELKKMGLIND